MDEFEYVADTYCLLCRHTYPENYSLVRFGDESNEPFVVEGLCGYCDFVVQDGDLPRYIADLEAEEQANQQR